MMALIDERVNQLQVLAFHDETLYLAPVSAVYADRDVEKRTRQSHFSTNVMS